MLNAGQQVMQAVTELVEQVVTSSWVSSAGWPFTAGVKLHTRLATGLIQLAIGRATLVAAPSIRSTATFVGAGVEVEEAPNVAMLVDSNRRTSGCQLSKPDGSLIWMP